MLFSWSSHDVKYKDSYSILRNLENEQIWRFILYQSLYLLILLSKNATVDNAKVINKRYHGKYKKTIYL